MNGTFNGQILVEKLARLNNSQTSIETLSHWCIFHMNKAKQVVETWARQFHCSPREQRLPYLYLANDILQNSRRKGSEFVAEFWKVLPDALSDVIENSDESGKNAAMRLITIWEERKVFGSRGKILKEEFVGKNAGNANKNEKTPGLKLKQSIGNILEKIISGYEVVYDGPVDEETLLSKCRTAAGSVDKIEKEIGSDFSSARLDGPEFVELQGQHGILRECIEQLRSAESSRETLLSHLREALQEQEFKLDEVRSQLQVAQSQSEKLGSICQQILTCKSAQLAAQTSQEPSTFSSLLPGFIPEASTASHDKEQSAPVMYTQRAPPNNSYVEDDPRKSAAAAVAAKLAASTSSAQMLTYVLSSLASEGAMGNQVSESSSEYPSEKRPKLDNGPSYIPSPQHPQPPLPPFPHPDAVNPPPPPPSSSPMQPPPPPLSVTPTQPSGPIMQTNGTMTSGGPFNYSVVPQRPFGGVQFPNYPIGAVPFPSLPPPFPSPPNPYLSYQGTEAGFYSQPPLPASPPISRQ